MTTPITTTSGTLTFFTQTNSDGTETTLASITFIAQVTHPSFQDQHPDTFTTNQSAIRKALTNAISLRAWQFSAANHISF